MNQRADLTAPPSATDNSIEMARAEARRLLDELFEQFCQRGVWCKGWGVLVDSQDGRPDTIHVIRGDDTTLVKNL